MRYKILLSLFFLLVNLITFSQKKPTDLYSFKIKKIKEGIYMAYRLEPLRKFVEGNVTIIINDKDVVLVDAGGSTTSAKNIIAEVRKLTKNPIRYVINTHTHADHTLGNAEYMRSFPGVEIISHSYTKKDIVENQPAYIESFSKNFDALRNEEHELIKQVTSEAKPGYQKVVAYLARYADQDIYVRRDEYAKLKATPATLICDEKMVLHRGTRIIEVMHLGAGDTPGDLVVYLPEDKIVCSGDMVVHPVPYGFSRWSLEWIESLKKLSALDFDQLVPGHGELQTGKMYVSDVLELLQSTHKQVRAGIEKGITKEALQNEIDVSFFTKKYLHEDPVALFRFTKWFLNPAIENAYKIYTSTEGK
jgi:cyclase